MSSRESSSAPISGTSVSAMPLLFPPSICRASCYTHKAPLVARLAAFYQSLPATGGRAGRGRSATARVFTPMMHGLLFGLEEEALVELMDDALLAEAVCRAAQAFVYTGMEEASVEAMLAADDAGLVAMSSSWASDVRRSTIVTILANTRDRGICVISGKMLGVEQVPIVPRSILASAAARELFRAVTPITKLLLGEEFAAEFKTRLPNDAADERPFNFLTLNSYLAAVFRTGRLGLRPYEMTRERDGGGGGGAGEAFRVHFTVHWMHRTVVSGDEAEACREPGLRSINAMLFQCRTEGRKSVCEFDADGKQINEGDCYFVTLSTADDALGMHDMLAFRWTVGVVFCLGGMDDAF